MECSRERFRSEAGFLFMKRSKKNHGALFTTRRGLMLSLSIGAFVALIFILVYFAYVLPMQRSLE
jgi:hypothetical protein